MEKGRTQLLNSVCFVLLLGGSMVFMMPREVIGQRFLSIATGFTAVAGIAGIVFMFTTEPNARRDPVLWAMVALLLVTSLFELF